MTPNYTQLQGIVTWLEDFFSLLLLLLSHLLYFSSLLVSLRRPFGVTCFSSLPPSPPSPHPIPSPRHAATTCLNFIRPARAVTKCLRVFALCAAAATAAAAVDVPSAAQRGALNYSWEERLLPFVTLLGLES